jgi:hypothetical protein
MSACLRTDPLLVGHGQMAWDRPWDTAVSGSHAPGVSTGEPCASAATRRVQGAPAAAAADGDRSDLLGSAVEAVDELAAFVAGGPAADRGWLTPAGISTLLGVEESATIRSARDQCGPPTPDSANELRQSSVGRAKNPRRAVEARPDGRAGDGVEVHGPASEAAVAGVAHVFEESRQGSHRAGFLHGAHGDVSSPVRPRDADPQPAPDRAFQCDGASDGGMDGAPTARGVRAGGGGPGI